MTTPAHAAPDRLLEKAGVGFEAGCAGKQAYPSENGARAALTVLQRAGLMRTGGGLNVYRCRYCGDWHYGHIGKAG